MRAARSTRIAVCVQQSFLIFAAIFLVGNEAFAAGIPVVSTRLGAEGLADQDGELCALADDAIKNGTPDVVADAALQQVFSAAVRLYAAKWEDRLQELAPADIGEAFALGLATLLRIVILIAIASLVWVPVGVWVGTRPRATRVVQPIAQFLAAFPANLLFPLVVSAIVAYGLDPDIWLSPLMILGTQWYILFNVIAGATAIPAELRDCCVNLQVRGWLWWRTTALPAVFPYYVTGAITAAGGSWNASIVAEVASWGDQRLEAYGLGAYIAIATQKGDFHRIVLGIAVMLLGFSALRSLRRSTESVLSGLMLFVLFV